MQKAIIGKKLGMTQIFLENHRAVPVTVVQAGPCPVVQRKTVSNEGYDALAVGFEAVKPARVTKPVAGKFKKAEVEPHRFLRELKLDDCDKYNVGDSITVDQFAEGDRVDVSGLTRGRGFTGVIQRWNVARGHMSHGAGYPHRLVGSMGANSSPSKVFKNKKMSGQYGHEKVTIQNLSVMKVDTERGLLLIKGALPGPDGNLLYVRSTVKS
ncbi:MAG: 50S ribosomal protein L3 [Clostridia bacterium]|nr:50S ribosomal protein L3 [Clostridia bacterium]